REIRPDIVHNVAIKPVALGSIAARFANRPAVVNALGGLGYVVASSSLKAAVLRPLVFALLRVAFGNERSRLIVQNDDDGALLIGRMLIAATKIRIIRGAGAETVAFPLSEQPPPQLLVIMPSRLLRDKGVSEFVDAARRLCSAGVPGRF